MAKASQQKNCDEIEIESIHTDSDLVIKSEVTPPPVAFSTSGSIYNKLVQDIL